MTEATACLAPELHQFLQQPRIVQLSTLDAQTGGPFANVISWVLARTPETIRLMGDTRTRFMQNIQADGRVALTVLGAGGAWTVYGTARVLAERTPGVPIPLALVEVTGLQVFPALFFGARLTVEPQWEVTYDRTQAERFDQTVFDAMRAFEG